MFTLSGFIPKGSPGSFYNPKLIVGIAIFKGYCEFILI